MKKRRHRGFLCNAGFWCPQAQIQITPFRWGVSGAISRKRIACMLGPITVSIWFTVHGLGAECRRFADPEV